MLCEATYITFCLTAYSRNLETKSINTCVAFRVPFSNVCKEENPSLCSRAKNRDYNRSNIMTMHA